VVLVGVRVVEMVDEIEEVYVDAVKSLQSDVNRISPWLQS
jgi:hypothetical protein